MQFMQKREYCPVCYKHLNAKYISQHREGKHPEVSKIDYNVMKLELWRLVQVMHWITEVIRNNDESIPIITIINKIKSNPD